MIHKRKRSERGMTFIDQVQLLIWIMIIATKVCKISMSIEIILLIFQDSFKTRHSTCIKNIAHFATNLIYIKLVIRKVEPTFKDSIHLINPT